MSLRELKALSVDSKQLKSTKTRSGTVIQITMNEEELQQQVQRLQAELAGANEELDRREEHISELEDKLERANLVAVEAQERADIEVKQLQKQLENQLMQSELTKLRAVNELHFEHQHSLQLEKERLDRERERTEAWMRDMKESF